jgi:hypothetical protein
MGIYFRSVRNCSSEYWAMLHEAVRELWTKNDVPFESTSMPEQQRLMGWLVASDRRADLERLLTFIEAHTHSPVRVQRGRVVCSAPGHEDAGVRVPLDWPSGVRSHDAPESNDSAQDREPEPLRDFAIDVSTQQV